MARKGRRKFRRYLKGKINNDEDLTVLAANTGVKKGLTTVVDDATWVSSVKALWSITGFTPTNGAGPIIVGIAHSDYTLAEIEEWIENTGAWNAGDLRSKEIAQRKIRQVGVFSLPETSNQHTVLNDGRPLTTKCGWVIQEDQSLALWFYNAGSVAVATTVPTVTTMGHANLWPQ